MKKSATFVFSKKMMKICFTMCKLQTYQLQSDSNDSTYNIYDQLDIFFLNKIIDSKQICIGTYLKIFFII